MDFSIKAFDSKNALAEAKTGCLVVGVFEKDGLSDAAKRLDAKGEISAALASGDLSGKVGSTLLLHRLKGIAAERVLLLGLGNAEKFNDKVFARASSALYKTCANLGAKDAVLALPLDEVKDRDAQWALRTLVLAGFEAAFKSDGLKSKAEKTEKGVKKFTLAVSEATQAKKTLAQAQATAHGIDLCKTLGNLPANICTPSHLAHTAQTLAKEYGFEVEVLDKKQLEALKMGCFLSVTRGSVEPPKFIVLKHQGGKSKDKPVVLVGKGITFDSGGISLKDGAGMDEMKFDMCGAAAVLGTMRAVGEMKLKQNIYAIVPSCENLPSGQASKPGDIVTSMAGLTIEILNTDAEGRLLLCDALTYAERFKPAVVIDVATLTGACITALGHYNSGLFARNDAEGNALAEALITAGRAASDTTWRMPLEEAYQEQLKSNFADLANIGTPGGGSITAACFLEHFTRAYSWAHLDIAGIAWKSGTAKGATGRPVGLLTQFLLARG